MHNTSLLTVKQAAAILQLDEHSVKEQLIKGQLKGKKKEGWLRDRWFVYRNAVEQALLEQEETLMSDLVSLTESSTASAYVQEADSIELDSQNVSEVYSIDWLKSSREHINALTEGIVKPLMEKIEVQQEVIFEQKQIIANQDHQLRLLPDLKKQEQQHQQEVELKHFENAALKLQLDALRIKHKSQLAQLEDELVQARLPWWKRLLNQHILKV